jgi:hypothetical protein
MTRAKEHLKTVKAPARLAALRGHAQLPPWAAARSERRAGDVRI